MTELARVENHAVADAGNGEDITRQYLTFVVRDETFAIGILHIKEIIEYDKVTTVPMMPPCVRGVINLRGAVVPVIDLARRFGLEPSRITRRSCIVILELPREDAATQVIGVTVDTVNEVMEISQGEIAPPPAFGAQIGSHFIEGMVRQDEGFIVLLDPGRVLSAEDLSLLARLDETAAPDSHGVN